MEATEAETYNGWTNYETWGCALILDNDEGLYEMVREKVEEAKGSETPNADLQDYLKELTETLCGIGYGIGYESEDYGIPEPSMMAKQLLAVHRIDFYEIASHYLED